MKVRFILSRKVQGTAKEIEYQYLIEVVSNSGARYISYDVWHGYGITAKDAKAKILFNISQTQAIDYIFDDIVINNCHGTPYFIQVNS